MGRPVSRGREATPATPAEKSQRRTTFEKLSWMKNAGPSPAFFCGKNSKDRARDDSPTSSCMRTYASVDIALVLSVALSEENRRVHPGDFHPSRLLERPSAL